MKVTCQSLSGIGRALAVLLGGGYVLGSGLACEARSRKDLVVAVEHEDAVWVLSATGAKLRVIRDRDLRTNGSGLGYYCPSVHPGQDSLAYVRCRVDWESPFSSVDRTMGCELVQADIAGEREQVQFRATTLDAPSWSPEGKRLVFLADDRIVLVEPETERTLWDVEVSARADHGELHLSSDPVGAGSYVRWSDDGSELYLLAAGIQFGRIARVDGLAGSIEWLDLQTPGFLYGKYDPLLATGAARSWPERHVLSGGPLPTVPAYSALFGSITHPVWWPSYSADSRFYFYTTRREGFFARGWVEGFRRPHT